MAISKPNYVSSTITDESRGSITEISTKREWTTAYTVRRLIELALGEFKGGLLDGRHPAPVESSETAE